MGIAADMIAIISDIHGNLDALRAVMDDIDSLNVKDIICLGDVIGYGPDPIECLDIVKATCRLSILGNHEEALLQGVPPRMHPRARRALKYTQRKLFGNENDPQDVKDERRAFMESMLVKTRIEGVTYVHGSPRSPTKEYVMPGDARNKKKMGEIFAHLEDYCFCGHTHMPGIFTTEGFTHPSDMFDLYMVGTDEKVLINVGSVGQPRDGDRRACFVTFDGDTVVWRRVEYDPEPTIAKIMAQEELEDFLGSRLREGR